MAGAHPSGKFGLVGLRSVGCAAARGGFAPGSSGRSSKGAILGRGGIPASRLGDRVRARPFIAGAKEHGSRGEHQ
jgi:hypothetical protein